MKAFLLAAGLGSRLRPITDTRPKCLVEVAGHPMLDWWAKLLLENDVHEILVNTHYLHEQVHEYIQRFNKCHTNIKFIEFYEETLLGSAGTVRENRAFVEGEDDFLICYADNLCNVKLRDMIAFHRRNAGILTMALFRTGNPKGCGIAALDGCGKIVDFIEKPEIPAGNLANAGIYAADKSIFNIFPPTGFLDFGKDILPLLAGAMYGWETNDYLIDIGTMDHYKRAKEEWNYDYCKDALTR